MLCNNILLAAQLDAGGHKPIHQELNLSDIVNGSAKDFTNRYPQRIIEVSVEEGEFVFGEELLIQMLVNNLIENALKYSPKEGKVSITLKAKDNKAILHIADEGSGIADEEKKQVFEKFYRSGDENIRNTKGTGLGLYLCKKIVEGHKGTIRISDNHPRGTIFTVTLNTYYARK